MPISIFKICPCCGKKLFLIHEIDLAMYFAKDEFEFHKEDIMKDPITGKFPDDYEGDERHVRKPGGYSESVYPERHQKEDWGAFDTFLHELQTSHGPLVYISIDDKSGGASVMAKIAKLDPSLQNTIGSWFEPKVKEKFFKAREEKKKEEEQKKQKKEWDKKFDDLLNWKDISIDLTDDIKREWIKNDFNFKQVEALVGNRITKTLGVGLAFSDYKFAAWLRDEPKYKYDTPEKIVTHGDLAGLRAEFKIKTQPKDKSGSTPPPPPAKRRNIREWYWARLVTEDELHKATNSDLSSILASDDPINWFTIDEAKEAIRKVKEWSPGGSTPPANWNDTLKEIHNFFALPQPSLANIDKALGLRWKHDPMIGVDLKGYNKAVLLTSYAKDATANAELQKAKGNQVKWKNYLALQSSGDGNCFFNAFSVLLNGNEDLATRLRVKVCLGIMSRKLVGNSSAKGEKAILKEINEKLPSMSSDANYEAWRSLDDIAYMSDLLARPIRLVYRPDVSSLPPTSPTKIAVEADGCFAYSEFVSKEADKVTIKYGYKTYFSIFHTGGNHFVPLIHPTLNDEIAGGTFVWGNVDIEFIALRGDLLGTPPTQTQYKCWVGPRKKIIGHEDDITGLIGVRGHPNDLIPGSLMGHEIKETIIERADLPASVPDFTTLTPSQVCFVNIRGTVRFYTDGDGTIGFEPGAKITFKIV